MLDKYEKTQTIIYQLLVNALQQDKISHAYLLETNRNVNAMDLVMSFVKAIICPNHYTNRNLCGDCHICDRIDDSNYLEIKVIEPDGMWIKKDQLLDLQEEFTKKGVEGEKRVYIIKQCDKMNAQAANSLLKFLEEPVENIHAILVTDHLSSVLPTIVSRCQLVSLSKSNTSFSTTMDALANLICNTKQEYEQFMLDESHHLMIDSIVEFILYLEQYKYDTIIYTKKLWHSIFKDRESNLIGFDLLIHFYHDTLRSLMSKPVIFFKDYEDIVVKVKDTNTMSSILVKLQILLDMREDIKYNLNANLLVDKLIISLGGVSCVSLV